MKCVHNENGRCNLFSNDWVDSTCTNDEDCPYRNPITNADKIRAMTDEELVEWHKNLIEGYCPRPASDCLSDCEECWRIWLKQEVQE